MMSNSRSSTFSDPGPVHSCSIPVRWTDFDRFGHMTNSLYIEIAQEARMAFAVEHFLRSGMDIPVVYVRTLDVDFFAPILPDTTEVLVDTQVIAIGHTSFTSRQKLRDRHGKICCILEVVQVVIDVPSQSPRPITDEEVRILSRAANATAIEGREQ